MQIRNKRNLIIEGIVTSLDWEDYKDSSSVTIITDDKEYFVEDTKAGKLLLEYLGEEVKVEGQVFGDYEGTARIIVKRFVALDSDGDDFVNKRSSKFSADDEYEEDTFFSDSYSDEDDLEDVDEDEDEDVNEEEDDDFDD
jgi:hypothetical protein